MLDQQALDNIYPGHATSYPGDVTSTGNPTQQDNIVGATIDVTDKNGNFISLEIAQDGSGLINGKHVHELIGNVNLGELSYPELLELMSKVEPEKYNKILEAVSGQGKNFEELAAFFAKNGVNLHVQGANLAGWQKALDSNLSQYVEKVITGYDYIKKMVPYTERIEKTVFDIAGLAKAGAVGAAAGIAGATIDGLHEAAHRTDRRRPGTFEKNNDVPEGETIEALVRRKQEELSVRKEENYEKDELHEELSEVEEFEDDERE